MLVIEREREKERGWYANVPVQQHSIAIFEVRMTLSFSKLFKVILLHLIALQLRYGYC